MSEGKLKVIAGGKSRDEETEVDEAEALERSLSEGKGRPTPGRRNQAVEEQEQGNIVTRPIYGFIEYLRDVRAELDKVTWPTREETIRLTRIVIITMVVSSVVLGLVSFLFTQLFFAGYNTPIILIVIIAAIVGVALYFIMRSNRTSGGY